MGIFSTARLAAAAIFATVTFGGGAALACPDFSQASGQSYAATGGQLFQPRVFPVIAGGPYAIPACGYVRPRTDRGPGFVTAPPDFSFQLSQMGGYSLMVAVEATCDSVLLINTGAVNWYYDDDDHGNSNPRIILNRPSNGRMDIWVGTYEGGTCDARLVMETFYR